VLRQIFGPKREGQKNGEDCVIRSLLFCTAQKMLLVMGDNVMKNGRGEGDACDLRAGFGGKI
jgi:hypothetical protein